MRSKAEKRRERQARTRARRDARREVRRAHQFGALRAWILRQPCVIPGCPVRPPFIQPAHVLRTRGALGHRRGHRLQAPLCASHHREQEDTPRALFEARHGVDLYLLVRDTWRRFLRDQRAGRCTLLGEDLAW